MRAARSAISRALVVARHHGVTRLGMPGETAVASFLAARLGARDRSAFGRGRFWPECFWPESGLTAGTLTISAWRARLAFVIATVAADMLSDKPFHHSIQGIKGV